MHYFSGRAQIALVAFAFLFVPIYGNIWEPCGDWIAYNDEKCFKIIDDTLRTFDEAKDACATQQQTSTLAVIRSSEEQQFLSNYLFKTEQKLENFWIGAQYSFQNSSYIWIDNLPLTYSNWDAGHSPQSRTLQCVHMQADESVAGKWKNGRCVKKNAVVCQRMQFWSTELLQKNFLDSRKQQADAFNTIRNLTQSLASANQRIAGLENLNQRFTEQQQSLDAANQRINVQKLNLELANQKISEHKQSLKNSNLRINEQIQSIDNVYERFNELQNKIVPVGFIYVQLPYQPEPKTLWPNVQWKDVTSTYAGVFFRAEGGDSKTFGNVQEENAPRVTKVKHEAEIKAKDGYLKWDDTTLNVGEWSTGIGVFSGNWPGEPAGTTHKFLMSGGEIRPRNMAVRIWKRDN